MENMVIDDRLLFFGNPITLREANVVYEFGLSACNRAYLFPFGE